MENKYSHLTVQELQEAIERAEANIAEQEVEIAGHVKDMNKKKATLSDIKHSNHMITFAFDRIKEYQGWVEEYTEALKRAERVEAGHTEIVEFLEHLLEEDLNWYEELKADYAEKGYKHYMELLKKDEITKTTMMFARMASQDALKLFKHDLDVRYQKLVLKVTGKVGKVLKIDVERNWNQGFDGLVTGENGTCRLTTILAGGYNIQRLHYRTICK